jgi:hypothetical protein
MDGGFAMMTCEWRFVVAPSAPAEMITDHADRIMASLLDREAVDTRLSDAVVSVDLDTRTVLVGMSVAGDDYEETVAHALAAIRSAVDAAGQAAAAWPEAVMTVGAISVDPVQSVLLEPHDFTVHA